MNSIQIILTRNSSMRWSTLGMRSCAALLWLGCIGPATADISAINPAEGTLGTEIVLTGSGFGDKRGKVDLGTENCKILSWNNTRIACQVTTPQRAGDYTITVSPQGSKKASVPMTFSSFAMRRPQITPGTPLRLVAPGELVTIEGAFFGDKKGDVYLVDRLGDYERARIRSWSMGAIRFEIPDGLTGPCLLGVINGVGLDIMPQWGTFTPVPPGAGAGSSYEWDGVGTIANASGVYFNNALWIFTLAPSSGNPYIGVFRIQDGEMDGFPWIWGDGETLATMAPIVINHELWLFVTGKDGVPHYTRYNPVTNQWLSSYVHIPGATTGSTDELAPVYNLVTHRIEVYYRYTNSIRWVYSDNYGTTWQTGGQVAGIGTVSTTPSAVFYQKSTNDYSTLLAAGISSTATVFTVHNGVASSPVRAPFGKVSGRPFLFQDGEDYVGLTWRDADEGNPWLCKMDKKTGQWLTKYQPLNVGTHWPPNAVVNFEQHPDTNAPAHSLGYLWNAHCYIIYGKKEAGQYQPIWQVAPTEYVGYWAETNAPTDLDLGAGNVYKDTFSLWPIVGIVDAPPFVLNGGSLPEECDEWACNNFSFGVLNETNTSIGYDLKAGAFVEDGEKSPLKLELSAAFTAKFESETNVTVELTDTLFSTTNSSVMAFYVAPIIRTHAVEWFNVTGVATSNYLYQMEIIGSNLRVIGFDPKEFPFDGCAGMQATYFDPAAFPYHASSSDYNRLTSYDLQSASNWFVNSADWNAGIKETDLQWTASVGQTKSLGFDMSLKIGPKVKEYFSIGAEGSFAMHATTSTKLSVTTKLHLAVGATPDPGDIKHFYTTAYWLAPDASAYWVPLNRRGMGDKPWFITFGVDPYSIDIKQ